MLLTLAAYVLFQELRPGRQGTACADAQVTTLRERLLKLAVWVERSVRRIVLHLPRRFPGCRRGGGSPARSARLTRSRRAVRRSCAPRETCLSAVHGEAAMNTRRGLDSALAWIFVAARAFDALTNVALAGTQDLVFHFTCVHA